LLEQIKNFEEQEFAGVASRDTEFKPRLQPLNESGGSALLKIVHIVFVMVFIIFRTVFLYCRKSVVTV